MITVNAQRDHHYLFMTSGITFCIWSIYLPQTDSVRVFQNALMPAFNSAKFFGLYLSLKNVFIDPQIADVPACMFWVVILE